MTQNPELSVVGRIEAMPELPVVAWITDDGRVATAQTKLVMGRPSKESFNDPLCKVSDALTYASQTLASRDGEIARLRDAAEFLLECFEPDRDAYVFSKRLALTKLRAAIQQTKDTK